MDPDIFDMAAWKADWEIRNGYNWIKTEPKRRVRDFTYRERDMWDSRLPKWIMDAELYKEQIEEGYRVRRSLQKQPLMSLVTKVCQENRLDILKLMIQNGLDREWWATRWCEYSDTYERISMMNIVIEAITDDQLAFVQCLVDAGWPVNSPRVSTRERHIARNVPYLDMYPTTYSAYPSPLAAAMKMELHSIIKYLMERGAKLTDLQIRGTNPFDEELVKILIQYKPESETTTLLRILSWVLTPSGDVYFTERRDVYTMLLNSIFDWILPILVQRKVDINTQRLKEILPDSGTLAEHIVSMGGCIKDEAVVHFLTRLLEYGLDLSHCCAQNENLLGFHLNSLPQTFKFLLDRGLNVNSLDSQGTPIFHHALRWFEDSEYDDYIQYLFTKAYVTPEDGYVSSYNNRIASVKVDGFMLSQMIEKGVDVNLEDSEGKSIFEKFMLLPGEHKEIHFMRLLLETEVKIKMARVHPQQLKNLGVGTLAILIFAGCRHVNLLAAAWEKVKDTKSENLIKLFNFVDPLHRHPKTEPGSEQILILDDFTSFPSLQALCVFGIHQHLYKKVTCGKSIAPRLRKLPGLLPKHEADILCFIRILMAENDIPEEIKALLSK